jgi:hypothetical protein
MTGNTEEQNHARNTQEQDIMPGTPRKRIACQKSLRNRVTCRWILGTGELPGGTLKNRIGRNAG